MSKIAEKKVIELGHFKDPFAREEFTANDIFDACVECYDQAMQDFLEKACEWLSNRIGINQEVVTNEEGQPLADSYIQYLEERAKAVKEITEDFKNYMQNEM